MFDIAVAPDACVDKIADCADYGKEVCETYVPWATERCQRFCKFCTPGISLCFYKFKFFSFCTRLIFLFHTSHTVNIDLSMEKYFFQCSFHLLSTA